MVKSRVQWTSTGGDRFTFEYEVKRNCEASSVKDVYGEIYHIAPNGDAGSTAGNPTKKKRKGEEKVGYLRGYELRRGANGNKLFHEHADCVSQELQDFACALFDSHGKICRAPQSSGMWSVLWQDGAMFLIEMIEIKPAFRGRDLGINLIHEYLSQPQMAKRIGLVVMYPWACRSGMLSFPESKQKAKEDVEGKSEAEVVDIDRRNTVKLRQQYTRIGFRAVADTADWANKWWMSMSKYKTLTPDNVKGEWLTKVQARQLDVAMPPKERIPSEKDKEMKDLLFSLKPNAPDPYAAQMQGLREQVEGMQQTIQSLQQFLNAVTGTETNTLTSSSERLSDMMRLFPNQNQGSKLTTEKKATIRRLVDEGASLHGIDALHLASASYKERDLFDLLIDEYGMDVEAFDRIGRRPIHVAALCKNPDAVRILISKGANKNALNKEGQEETDQEQRSTNDFTRIFGGSSHDPLDESGEKYSARVGKEEETTRRGIEKWLCML